MRAWWLALAVVWPGCGGTEIGNPGKTSAALRTVTYSSDAQVSIGPSAAAIQVTGAWLKLARVTYSRCDETIIGVVSVPSACDLLSNEHCVPAPDFAAPDVCKVDLELDTAVPTPVGAPAELSEAMLWIGGMRADGTPFVVTGGYDQPMRVHNPVPFDLASYDRLVLGTNLGGWFEANDLDGTTPDGEGIIRVNSMTYPEITALIEDRVRWEFGLYSDADGDGALSAEELATPVATP